MALKGTTKIELTDVKTGKKEIIEKHNLVTNAVSEILSVNPFGAWFRHYGNGFAQTCLPVVPKLIGGILLYENALEEDQSKYYADMDNPLVGYSSNDVNQGTDTKRGSLNQTESGMLEDGTGYRFVFDFTTSQANGKISALGLTSQWGGMCGHGSAQDNTNSVICLGKTEAEETGYGVSATLRRRMLNSIVAIDTEANRAYSARLWGDKTVELGKFSLPFTGVGLFQSFTLDVANEGVYATYLTTEKFGAVYSTSNFCYATFVDGGDGYIWGFQHAENAKGNASGQTKVLWIKISKTDFTFEEGEWTFDAQLYPFGSYQTNDDSYYLYNLNYTIIKDGYLYALKYDRKGVYKIGLDNITDITLMECTWEINVAPHNYSNYDYSRMTGTAVNEVAGVITYENAYISAGMIHFRAHVAYSPGKDYLDRCLFMSAKPGIRQGPYMLGFALVDRTYNSYYATRTVASVYLPTTYLATINNLENPVQKTADKTMKITYILREE